MRIDRFHRKRLQEISLLVLVRRVIRIETFPCDSIVIIRQNKTLKSTVYYIFMDVSFSRVKRK